MGIIIWLVILVYIISSVKKNNTGMTKGKQGTTVQKTVINRSVQGKTLQKPVANVNVQQREKSLAKSGTAQQELKARLAKKYGKTTDTEILKRAKESVQEDFSDDGYGRNARVQREERVDEKTSELLWQIEENHTSQQAEYPKVQQNVQKSYIDIDTETVLDTVMELMVKGPNTELPFERDFLAEGMDMLNKCI